MTPGRLDELRQDPGRFRPIDVIAAAVLLTVAGVVLAQSWFRWLHPVIDAGRDLYLATHLLRDTTLYVDVAYVYPPLAPHLLAGATALFGDSLATFAAIGIAIGAVVACALYALARRYTGTDAAFASSLTFVAACFAGATTYGSNFVFPYTYSATLGLAFFLVFLCATARLVVDGESAAGFVVALAAGTAAALCKLEFTLFVVVTGAAALVLMLFTGRLTPARSARAALVALASLLAPFLVARVTFGPLFFESVLPGALLTGPVARAFYEKVTGLDRWRENLTLALIGAVLTLIHCLLVRAIGRWSERGRRGVVGYVSLFALLVALAAVVFVLGNDRFFRGWLVLQLSLVPFAVQDLRRVRSVDESQRGRFLLMPLLLVAALSSTSRIWLNLSPVWYGFVFVVPVLPLIVDVLFRYLPSRGMYARRAAVLWIPLFVVLAGREVELQRTAWAASAFAVDTTRGRFFDSSADRAHAIVGLLERLDEVGADELVVVPEGLTINYAANVTTPMRINTFTPAELPTPEHERAAIADFERVKPEYVAVTTAEAAAFGFRGFGVDYGLELDRYIRANYVLDRQWRSQTFSVFLLRRR